MSAKPATEMMAEEIKSEYEGELLCWEDGRVHAQLESVDPITESFSFRFPDGEEETMTHTELFNLLSTRALTF